VIHSLLAELLFNANERMKAQSPSNRCSGWVLESNNAPLERAAKEMENVQEHLRKLSSLLAQLDTAVDSEV
jgi:hypothetical protein